MASAILILFAMPVLDVSRIRSNAFRPLMGLFYWLFAVNFLLLIFLGSIHVEEPFITLGQFCTAFYFFLFLSFRSSVLLRILYLIYLLITRHNPRAEI